MSMNIKLKDDDSQGKSLLLELYQSASQMYEQLEVFFFLHFLLDSLRKVLIFNIIPDPLFT